MLSADGLVLLPLLAGVLGVCLGAAMAAGNFCTLGALADLTLMGDRARLGAWLLAIGLATLGFAARHLVAAELPPDPRIDYLSPLLRWPRLVLGGALFGVGMTLAAGCVSKNLLRLGGGSLKAAVTLAAAGGAAWALNATGLYGTLFAPWLDGPVLDLRRYGYPDQQLGTLLGASTHFALMAGITVSALGVVLARQDRAVLLGGVAVGLAVSAAWWLTASPLGSRWVEAGLFMDTPPRGLGLQSLTFVGPLADAVTFIASGSARALTFGLCGAIGVALGGLVHALLRGRFRREGFRDRADLARNVAGGLLMGTGGVLAMGCSIGQGVTGVSTLAAGSWLALLGIVAGAVISLRVQLALAG